MTDLLQSSYDLMDPCHEADRFPPLNRSLTASEFTEALTLARNRKSLRIVE